MTGLNESQKESMKGEREGGRKEGASMWEWWNYAANCPSKGEMVAQGGLMSLLLWSKMCPVLFVSGLSVIDETFCTLQSGSQSAS